jgi:hypothetical protein
MALRRSTAAARRVRYRSPMMPATPALLSSKRPSCAPITLRCLHGIAIHGRVRRPTTMPWTERLTLEDAIRAAGGVVADANRAVLIRLGSDPAIIALEHASEVALLRGDQISIEPAPGARA